MIRITDLTRSGTATQLRDVARAIAPENNEDRHWSLLAAVLGRVEEGAFYAGYGFASTRAWAGDELRLGADEVRVLLTRLWPMMVEVRDIVGLDEWRAVPRPRAELLVRVLKVPGVDVRRWVKAAIESKTAAFREAVDQALGREAFDEFSVRIPPALRPVIDRAMALALHEVFPDLAAPSPARAADPDTAFRCLEVIVTHYLTEGPRGA